MAAAYTGHQNEFKKLTAAQRAAIGKATAPEVVEEPANWLGSAARFEAIKEQAMEAQTITTDEMYADPMAVPGRPLVRTIGDTVYPYRPFEGAWYIQTDPNDLNKWQRFETPAARDAWFAARMAEEMARVDAVFASLDEAARRIEARCEMEDNSPARQPRGY